MNDTHERRCHECGGVERIGAHGWRQEERGVAGLRRFEWVYLPSQEDHPFTAARVPEEEARCQRCGHGDASHYMTGETDIDGRSVGAPYETCSECVEADLEHSAHAFEPPREPNAAPADDPHDMGEFGDPEAATSVLSPLDEDADESLFVAICSYAFGGAPAMGSLARAAIRDYRRAIESRIRSEADFSTADADELNHILKEQLESERVQHSVLRDAAARYKHIYDEPWAADEEARIAQYVEMNAASEAIFAAAALVESSSTPPASLDALFREIAVWTMETFPAQTPRSAVLHAKKEIDIELLGEGGDPADPEEQADVVMLMIAAAASSGNDLPGALRAKLAKNRTRTWGAPDADGVQEHVRGASTPPTEDK